MACLPTPINPNRTLPESGLMIELLFAYEKVEKELSPKVPKIDAPRNFLREKEELLMRLCFGFLIGNQEYDE